MRELGSVFLRILAVFLVSALSAIGAGSILGFEAAATASLAGILAVARVVEELARGFLDDGRLSKTEINNAFRSYGQDQ
jgi:hypothetical protein